MPQDGEQTDVPGGGGGDGDGLRLYCAGATARGLGWLQAAAGVPGSEQLSSFFNVQLPPTSGPGEGDLPRRWEGEGGWGGAS